MYGLIGQQPPANPLAMPAAQLNAIPKKDDESSTFKTGAALLQSLNAGQGAVPAMATNPLNTSGSMPSTATTQFVG